MPGFPKRRQVALRCNVRLCAVCAGQLAPVAVFQSAFGLPLLGRPNLAHLHGRPSNARGESIFASPGADVGRMLGLHRAVPLQRKLGERAGAGQGVNDLKARIVMKVTTYVSMGLTTNPPHDLVPPSRNSEFAHVIRCVYEQGGADFFLRVCSVFGTREILRLGVLLHGAVPRQIGE